MRHQRPRTALLPPSLDPCCRRTLSCHTAVTRHGTRRCTPLHAIACRCTPSHADAHVACHRTPSRRHTSLHRRTPSHRCMPTCRRTALRCRAVACHQHGCRRTTSRGMSSPVDHSPANGLKVVANKIKAAALVSCASLLCPPSWPRSIVLPSSLIHLATSMMAIGHQWLEIGGV